MNGLLTLWKQAVVVQQKYRMGNSSETGEFGAFQAE